MNTQTKCGFVAVIGLPNAGKSTFMNALIGQKISIVSRKVQTTRTRVLGILTEGAAQIIFVDTPGIFSAKKTLEKAMVKAAWDAVPEADVIAHIVDASNKDTINANGEIFKKLPENVPVVLVLNKVDKVKKEKLLEMAQALNERYDYAATFMISSLKEQGLKDVLEDFAARLPDSPWMFEEDQITDMPMRMMAAEITREKIYDQLHEELPYAIFVETESWENFDNDDVKITQLIYVQKDSQKGIVLGKGGSQIKKIGKMARTELEEMLEQKVHLKLFVKVKENWQDHPDTYRLMGLSA